MLNTFSVLSPHLKFKYKFVSINNLAFKFHYRATFLILLICTLLVTSRQYIGEHIRCITGGSLPEHVINTFCFFTTTYTVVRHFNETLLQEGTLPHPGVGPVQHDEPVKYHAYYQWVPFVLFLQALTFILPHRIWRSYEGGKLKNLVDGLHMAELCQHNQNESNIVINSKYTLFSRTTIDKKLLQVRQQFFQHIAVQRFWAMKLVQCEVLNVFNCILQMWVTNWFLKGNFIRLGIEFLNEDFTGTMDVLDIVFPKVTKCHFFKYGASGSIQKHDALCVMALNVINEKIYTFLWFWYIVLLVVSILAILWRILTMVLHSRSAKFNGLLFSLASPGRLNLSDTQVITHKLNFSEWLFLYYLAKNMDPHLFRKILKQIVEELSPEKERSIHESIDDEHDDENDEKGDVEIIHETKKRQL